jgi:hypothetical protein
VNFVNFDLDATGDELLRRTTVRRDGQVQHVSDMTPIRRV